MESRENISQESPLSRLVQARLEFLDPNEGSFLRLYVKERLDVATEAILGAADFSIVYALTAEDLKSEKVQKLILSSQYIADQNRPENLRPHVPFRVALVITRAVLDETMKDREFSWMWSGELQYGWIIDEDEAQNQK